MRVATYNIYEGADTPERYARLFDFVEEHDIDILCLQEATGWADATVPRFEHFARHSGLPHAVFGNSNSACKLATFSRFPVVNSEVHTDGFWHCAIETTLQTEFSSLKLVNTHLFPFREGPRLKEAMRLTEVATDGIVVGDFNSLSRADRYPDTFAQTLAAQGNMRYGSDSLRFDVTDYLAERGFIDVGAFDSVPAMTFPARTDCEENTNPMRLDYAFIAPGLEGNIKDVEVIKDEITADISDHYPLVLTVAL